MTRPLSKKERSLILEMFDEGATCHAIARAAGVAASTVSRVCRDEGRVFDRSKQLLEQRAAESDLKDLRARVAAKMLIVAEDTLDSLDAPHLVYNFGGKDNTYEEHLLDEAPIDTRLNAMRAASLAVDKAARIIEREPDGGLEKATGVLDDLAEGFKLAAEQYRARDEAKRLVDGYDQPGGDDPGGMDDSAEGGV